MTINYNRPVQTRSGIPVRIICTDAQGNNPIVGLVEERGQETTYRWYKNGNHFQDIQNNPFDLMNVPEKRNVWINFYDDNFNSQGHPSKEVADK